MAHNEKRRRPQFFRWFVSQTHQVARVDGAVEHHGETYGFSEYADFKREKADQVFYGMNSVFCESQKMHNGTMPIPNFEHFEFVGEGDIDFQTVYIWHAADHHDHNSVTYAENAHTGDPVYLQVHDRRTGPSETIEYRFFEFDAAPQDPNIFHPSAEIQRLCVAN
ncbi:uncharacterized protein AMSG_10809 [Thecamonas trahens ATCC 50062]|uniref:Uncharacterized protein n=1 Tax=Thecamonas trahens ATCC 50062 TaxID=461836 RepID=A0A0L0DT31_THETB|nr:hypothetical protein AMSG_10809 [Thecamonas trahens ATCC 50062]KNC55191.1 hypothetical protein AMSG_10809 [Thecamonas trahens ATCC 50062]|eukprot:XP_013753243.1 hypothetical protein AMSG_10809 [Thecamonas trahens ATCC 50062]